MVKTINVKLPDDLYRQLRMMMVEADAYSWEDFFRKIVSHEVDVYFEVISVDDEEPERHTIEFRLGDYIYRYENGDIILVSSPRRRIPLMGVTRSI